MGNPLLLSKTKGQRPTDETRGMEAVINILELMWRQPAHFGYLYVQYNVTTSRKLFYSCLKVWI